MVCTIGSGTVADYYLKEQANYYVGGVEPPGRWFMPNNPWGLDDGATIDSATFFNLHEGRSPDGAVALGKAPASGKGRMPAYDLQFAAPKSLSVLWFSSDDATRAAIEQAHYTAVRAALDVALDHAAFTRRGRDGRTVEKAPLYGAIFQHGEARAPGANQGDDQVDPQLHSHVVIFNLTNRDDGSWGSVDGRHLYHWKMAFGAIYRAELSAQIERTLGCEIHRKDDKGLFEVVGVPEAVRLAFSSRRAEIEALMAAYGMETGDAPALAAALAASSRSAKSRLTSEHAVEQRSDGWHERLEELGYTASDLDVCYGREMSPDAAKTREATFDKAAAELPFLLTETESVIPEHDLFEMAGAICTGSGRDAAAARALVRNLLEKNLLVRLPSPGAQRSDDPSLLDGDHATDGKGEALYTTPELVQLERELYEMVDRSANDSRHVLPRELVERHIAQLSGNGRPLTAEQADGLRWVTTLPGLVRNLEGGAGTGKSYSLRPVTVLYRDLLKEVYSAQGYRVIGASAKWITAKAMVKDADLADADSQAAAKWIADFKAGKASVDAKTLLIVDEAGQMGVRDMHALLSRVIGAGGKVILTGDLRQQLSVGAGPAMQIVSSRMESLRLEHSQRMQPQADDVLVHIQGMSRADAIMAANEMTPTQRKALVEQHGDETARRAEAWFADPRIHITAADILVHLDGLSRDKAEARAAAMDPEERHSLVTLFAETVQNAGDLWARKAASDFSYGRATDALSAFVDHGRFRWADTHLAALQTAVEDWKTFKAAQPGEAAIVIAKSNTDVRALNLLMRNHMREVGALSGSDQFITTINRRKEEISLPIAVGEQVLFTKRNEALGVFNGTVGHVLSLARSPADGHWRMIIQLDHGTITLDTSAYSDEGGRAYLEHCYATTAFSAQGSTRAAAFAMIDSGYTSNAAYVAASRASQFTVLYASREREDMRLWGELPLSERKGVRFTDEQRMASLGAALARAQTKTCTRDYYDPGWRDRIRTYRAAGYFADLETIWRPAPPEHDLAASPLGQHEGAALERAMAEGHHDRSVRVGFLPSDTDDLPALPSWLADLPPFDLTPLPDHAGTIDAPPRDGDPRQHSAQATVDLPTPSFARRSRQFRAAPRRLIGEAEAAVSSPAERSPLWPSPYQLRAGAFVEMTEALSAREHQRNAAAAAFARSSARAIAVPQTDNRTAAGRTRPLAASAGFLRRDRATVEGGPMPRDDAGPQQRRPRAPRYDRDQVSREMEDILGGAVNFHDVLRDLGYRPQKEQRAQNPSSWHYWTKSSAEKPPSDELIAVQRTPSGAWRWHYKTGLGGGSALTFLYDVERKFPRHHGYIPAWLYLRSFVNGYPPVEPFQPLTAEQRARQDAELSARAAEREQRRAEEEQAHRIAVGETHTAAQRKWAGFLTPAATPVGNYLERRGINRETQYAYADAIRFHPSFGTACFKHTGADGALTGFEAKGDGYSGFSKGPGGKSLGLFVAGGTLTAVRRVVIIETSVDVLARAQQDGCPSDTLYVSTGGVRSPEGEAHLLDLLRRLPDAKVILATDRDAGGFDQAEHWRKVLKDHPGGVDRELPRITRDWNNDVRLGAQILTEAQYKTDLFKAFPPLTVPPEAQPGLMPLWQAFQRDATGISALREALARLGNSWDDTNGLPRWSNDGRLQHRAYDAIVAAWSPETPLVLAIAAARNADPENEALYEAAVEAAFGASPIDQIAAPHPFEPPPPASERPRLAAVGFPETSTSNSPLIGPTTAPRPWAFVPQGPEGAALLNLEPEEFEALLGHLSPRPGGPIDIRATIRAAFDDTEASAERRTAAHTLARAAGYTDAAIAALLAPLSPSAASRSAPPPEAQDPTTFEDEEAMPDDPLLPHLEQLDRGRVAAHLDAARQESRARAARAIDQRIGEDQLIREDADVARPLPSAVPPAPPESADAPASDGPPGSSLIGAEYAPDESHDKRQHQWLKQLAQYYEFDFAAKFENDIEWVRARPGNEEVVVQFRDGSRLRDTGRSILITGRPSPAKAALLIEIAQAQGLKSITLRGSMEFKKDLALECYRAGIVVRNAEMQGFMRELARTQGEFTARQRTGRQDAPAPQTPPDEPFRPDVRTPLASAKRHGQVFEGALPTFADSSRNTIERAHAADVMASALTNAVAMGEQGNADVLVTEMERALQAVSPEYRGRDGLTLANALKREAEILVNAATPEDWLAAQVPTDYWQNNLPANAASTAPAASAEQGSALDSAPSGAEVAAEPLPLSPLPAFHESLARSQAVDARPIERAYAAHQAAQAARAMTETVSAVIWTMPDFAERMAEIDVSAAAEVAASDALDAALARAYPDDATLRLRIEQTVAHHGYRAVAANPSMAGSVNEDLATLVDISAAITDWGVARERLDIARDALHPRHHPDSHDADIQQAIEMADALAVFGGVDAAARTLRRIKAELMAGLTVEDMASAQVPEEFRMSVQGYQEREAAFQELMALLDNRPGDHVAIYKQAQRCENLESLAYGQLYGEGEPELAAQAADRAQSAKERMLESAKVIVDNPDLAAEAAKEGIFEEVAALVPDASPPPVTADGGILGTPDPLGPGDHVAAWVRSDNPAERVYHARAIAHAVLPALDQALNLGAAYVLPLEDARSTANQAASTLSQVNTGLASLLAQVYNDPDGARKALDALLGSRDIASVRAHLEENPTLLGPLHGASRLTDGQEDAREAARHLPDVAEAYHNATIAADRTASAYTSLADRQVTDPEVRRAIESRDLMTLVPYIPQNEIYGPHGKQAVMEAIFRAGVPSLQGCSVEQIATADIPAAARTAMQSELERSAATSALLAVVEQAMESGRPDSPWTDLFVRLDEQRLAHRDHALGAQDACAQAWDHQRLEDLAEAQKGVARHILAAPAGTYDATPDVVARARAIQDTEQLQSNNQNVGGMELDD